MSFQRVNSARNVLQHIESHLDEHLKNIEDFLRQPSISFGNRGIKETAGLLRDKFSNLSCNEIEFIEHESYYPIVIGKRKTGGDKTLIIYMMYDTMPIDDIDEWSVPPLEGRVVNKPPFGKCVLARGAYNTKGALMAFLNALESINAVEGGPPVDLILLAEGEEELCSPHLASFMAARGEEFRNAAGLFFPMPSQDSRGVATFYLGSKGSIDFDLECRGGPWGGPKEHAIHSSMQAVIGNPAWHLIKALNSLAGADGDEILIDGFYDKVKEPTHEDLELLEELIEKFDPEVWKETFKVDKYASRLTSPREILSSYIFSPSISICGMTGGYTGPGGKTIIPHEASAKINVRLVPNQLPLEIYRLIKEHLDKRGFRDLTIKENAGNLEPSRFDLHSPLAKAILQTYQDKGLEIQIWPLAAYGWPAHLFGKLGIQCFSGGVGHGGNMHAPDEYLAIEGNGKVGGLLELEGSFVQILYNFRGSAANGRTNDH